MLDRERYGTRPWSHVDHLAELALCTMVVVGVSTVACNREPEGLFAQHEEPAAPVGPLRYDTTVAAARRPGERTTTLLEVASPTSGRMRAVVGSLPADATDIVTEIWTFDQRDTGVLTLLGERTPALRMRAADPTSSTLENLRVELASPGAEVHRPLGIDGSEPAAVLATMSSAAIVVRDTAQTAQARLDALATVVRGLDDGPLLEQDALGRALDELAAGHWTPASTRVLSERRSEITTPGGAVLELHRKGEGWAIAALR